VSTLRHIHIGSGSLGLGLICWATKNIGFNVTVLNRSSSASNDRNSLLKAQRNYSIIYPNGQCDTVEISNFLFVPNDEEEAFRLIKDENTVLLTTSLKKTGIDEIINSGFLERLLEERANSNNNPLLFVACENAITSTEVANKIKSPILRQSVIPIDCVVDRICNKPFTENGKIGVICEPHAEWILKQNSPHTDLFTQNDHIKIVEKLSPYIYRKRWIVNALHLSAAILAHSDGYPVMNKYLMPNTDGRRKFDNIASEFEMMFTYWLQHCEYRGCFSTNDMESFYNSTRLRISGHPQSVDDATTRLKEKEIISFIKDFYKKVVDPFLKYTVESKNSLYHIPQLIAMVHKLIAYDKYLDS